MAVTTSDVQKLYVAYFNRPADVAGLDYWTKTSGATIADIAKSFSEVQEYKDTFANKTNTEIVAKVYENLFGHEADFAGLNYWVNLLNENKIGVSEVVTTIYNGALTTDKDILTNKVAAATAFTDAIDTAAEAVAYTGEAANAVARAYLSAVTADAASVTAAAASANDVLAQMIVDSVPAGQTLTLTTSIDNVSLASSKLVDKIYGVVDGNDHALTDRSTFTVGDIITGNDKTILHLALAESGDAAYAVVSHIDTIELVNANTGTNDVVFDALEWNNIGQITLNAGVPTNGNVVFNNLEDGVDLTLAIAGTLTANYNNGDEISLSIEKGDFASYVDSALQIDAAASNVVTVDASNYDGLSIGDINFTAAKGAEVIVHANYTAAPTSGFSNGDTTIGNVVGTLAPAASFYLTASGTGDMTVGDITITGGGKGASSTVLLNNVGGSVSVGNVSLAGGASGSASFSLNNVSATGDVTVGDITMSVGSFGELDLGITNSDSGASIGSYTVGDINLTVGNDATASMTLDFSVTATAGTETMGAMTIGDTNLVLGADATIDVHINQGMYQTSGGSVSVSADAQGDFLMGDLNATLGIGASLDYSLTVENTASGDIGNVTIGDFTLAADDGAYISYSIDVLANDGDGGDIGSLTIGNVDVVLGASATLEYYQVTVAANNVGQVAIGDVSLNVAVSASVYSIECSVTAATDIGSITVGDLTVVLDASSTIGTLNYSFSAVDGDIGSVVFGDFHATVGVSASFDDLSYDVIAGGSIGSVTFGDASVVVDSSGSMNYSVTITGDNGVGAVTFGDFDATSHNAESVEFFINVSAAHDNVGSLTIGDVTIAVDTSASATVSATVTFDVSVSASRDAGAISIGNIDLSVTADTLVKISVDSTASTDASIHIAGFALHGTGLDGTEYQLNLGHASNTAATPTVPAYDGNIKIDSLVVDVSATAAAKFDLSDVLSNLTIDTSVGATATITLGSIDYSGYTVDDTVVPYPVGAVIDVSTYKGNITVIGSALDDTITDNTGVNVFTGGAGNDTFSFLTMNANNIGLTTAKADVITDFQHGVDTIDLQIPLSKSDTFDAGTYFEGTYASFAAFITGAKAQMTNGATEDNIVAGQVGSDVYIAVDMDDGDKIDTVIKLTGVSLNGAHGIDFADFFITYVS